MNPLSALGLDVKFRQRWEFRDGRSDLSTDDSLSNNYDKPQECDSPASQLPSPENDRGKDRSSSLKAKKSRKFGTGKTRKVKSAKKKRPDFVNFSGTASIFDISISHELQVHMRSVLEDLDAERLKMSTWMWDEMEKMAANGVAPRGRGKHGVLGCSCERKSTGRRKSEGPDEINSKKGQGKTMGTPHSGRIRGKDENNRGKQKAADSKGNIGHDSTSIPLDGRNSIVRADGPRDLRDIGSSGATAGVSNEQSLRSYPTTNGFLDYSNQTIPRCSALPLRSSGSNCNIGSRPTNPGVEDGALTHPDTRTYPPIPLLARERQPMENLLQVNGVSLGISNNGFARSNFWSNLTNSMVARFE